MIEGSHLTLGKIIYVYDHIDFSCVPVDSDEIRLAVMLYVVVQKRDGYEQSGLHLYHATGPGDLKIVETAKYAQTVDEALRLWVEKWLAKSRAITACVEAVEDVIIGE